MNFFGIEISDAQFEEAMGAVRMKMLMVIAEAEDPAGEEAIRKALGF